MVAWQWHQLNHMQIISTLLQTDNHTSTSSRKFLQAGWSSRCQTNGVKIFNKLSSAVLERSNVPGTLFCGGRSGRSDGSSGSQVGRSVGARHVTSGRRVVTGV